MKKRNHLLITLVAVILLVALDQYTKYLAVLNLKGQSAVPLISGVLELTYVENLGAAFGLMQNARIFFLVMTAVVIVVVCYVLLRMPADKKYRWMRLLLTLILAGAAGNLIDRIRTVYVVDFIYFSLIDFPVFNVADMYVTVSTVLLILVWTFYYKEEDFTFLKRPDRA